MKHSYFNKQTLSATSHNSHLHRRPTARELGPPHLPRSARVSVPLPRAQMDAIMAHLQIHAPVAQAMPVKDRM